MEIMDATRLKDFLLSRQPVWEKDKAFWAYVQKAVFPLFDYDEETWDACASEGQPSASVISDTSALLKHIEEAWAGHEIDIKVRAGRTYAKVSLSDPSLERGVMAEFSGQFPLSEMGSCLAIAFLQANEAAISLQQRLLCVRGLEAPPYEEWDIEEVEPGRFGAVHHGLRLLCATANSPEGADRHRGMNHKGDYGVMLCRERYEKTFPNPDPANEAPGL